MQKRKIDNLGLEKLAVSDKEAAYVMSTGVATVRKFSEEAGARFSIGNRKLNNLKKLQEYMDRICEGGGNVADVIDIKGR